MLVQITVIYCCAISSFYLICTYLMQYRVYVNYGKSIHFIKNILNHADLLLAICK